MPERRATILPMAKALQEKNNMDDELFGSFPLTLHQAGLAAHERPFFSDYPIAAVIGDTFGREKNSLLFRKKRRKNRYIEMYMPMLPKFLLT
ncbi:hypothetical protein [Novosphingobium terrae]|uniref:hypothetical protein n=1 Tax=Novosphingobium terrae TaxID=2726189 RepID=UPI00197E542F|nr:hypothetical protein [Novosphingobium terrae]